MIMIKFLFASVVTCIGANMFSQKVDSLNVYSEAMKKDIKTFVAHPSKSKTKKLPIVYILHGYSYCPRVTINQCVTLVEGFC